MGLLSRIRSWARRQLSPGGVPTKIDPDFERAWLSEQVRAYASYSPQKLTGFAENYTEETPEIKAAYPTFLREPTLKMAFWSKVWAVASLELNSNPADKRSAADKRAAQYLKHAIATSKGGTRKVCESILVPGLMKGWSLSEKVFDTQDAGEWRGLWTLKVLKAKDTKFLWPEVDEYKNVVSFWASHANAGRRFNPEDFVVWVYQQLFESPTGISDFRAINRAVTLKEACIKLRMIFLDKFTGPWLKGHYSVEHQRAYLEASLKKARAAGYIVMEQGSDVEVVDLAMRGTADFEAAINYFDKEILVGLRGAHLDMMEGSANVRGDTEVHHSVGELVEWALKDSVECCLNEQLAPDLIYPNFGRGVGLPRISLGAINPKDVVADLEIDKVLYEMDVPLSLSDVYERAGRTPPKDELDVLKKPAPQPNPLLAREVSKDDQAKDGQGGQSGGQGTEQSA